MRTLALAVVLLVAAFAGVATAAKPLTVEDVRFDPSITEPDTFLTAACGFAVTFSAKGHLRGKVYSDRNGEFVRFVGLPSFVQTLTSPYGSITTSDRGMDRITENADGTIDVFGTGIHIKVKGEAYAIGLWRLTVDPATGTVLTGEYHGNFGLEQPEILGYLCDELGP